MRARELVAAVLALLAILPAAWGDDDDRLEGFSALSSERQRRIESRLAQTLSTERVGEHLRWLTSRPHPAGSEGARITAEYLHRRLVEYGWETETIHYDALLPSPVSVSIELVEPIRQTLPTTEEPVEGDPFTARVDEHPGWNAYSPSGEATGQVVYAHHGSGEDFATLAALGVDARGKILLMRYFGTGEGRKVRNAERAGASGVVLYSDPAEDGYPFGDVYPRGNWRPAGSIMRRSIISLPGEGDPLSPGWASLPGAKRLRPEEVSLPKIPVLPVSYGTAERILSHIAGPVAPPEWQGRLPLTYKIGPGPAALHLKTEMDIQDRPMLDVVGRLRGERDPDQWVIVSNHHDAWIFGAGDPSSGTAALLELARVVGERARRGDRPRRTLIVAFWDAEEMILGGSTEWVEEHAGELLEKAVACINMDAAVFNPDRPLSVAAHPTLHALFRSVSREVPDPRAGRSTFEVWRGMQSRFREVPSVDGWGELFDPDRELAEPRIFAIPYDDAAPFFSYLALPASDMYYGADYGMYHSIYENFHWMKTVVDPTFEYHAVMAQVQGRVALRLANAELPPLDFGEEARLWRMAYADLDGVARKRGGEVPELGQAMKLIDRWEAEAEGLERDARVFLSDAGRVARAGSKLPGLSRAILQMPRDFLRPGGRPDAPLDRNLFAGSSYDFESVSGSTLPGLRFALDTGAIDVAKAEAAIYLKALRRRIESLRSLRREMSRIE